MLFASWFRPAPARGRQVHLDVESLEGRLVPTGVIAAGTDAGPVATVRLFIDTDANGTYETRTASFHPFGNAFKGGVRVAMGDLDGDGKAELIAGQGVGGGKVGVWKVNADGTIGSRTEWITPWAGFTGGVFVAAGDLNNDGKDELAISRGSQGNSISIYSDTNADGKVGDTKTDAFNPWGKFQGGVRLAFGDTNNTGGDELIVARGPGGPATVVVYTDSNANRAVSDNTPLEQFTAFGGGYTGGITVAAGPVDSAGTGGAEIIVARDSGLGVVRIFSDANADGLVNNDPLFDSFNVYNNFKGGVRVAAGDTDASGFLVEVIVGPGPGGGTLAIRDDNGDTGVKLGDNPPTDSFPAFGAAYKSGFFVAFGKV
jgi:hypothetical protein